MKTEQEIKNMLKEAYLSLNKYREIIEELKTSDKFNEIIFYQKCFEQKLQEIAIIKIILEV